MIFEQHTKRGIKNFAWLAYVNEDAAAAKSLQLCPCAGKGKMQSSPSLERRDLIQEASQLKKQKGWKDTKILRTYNLAKIYNITFTGSYLLSNFETWI